MSSEWESNSKNTNNDPNIVQHQKGIFGGDSRCDNLNMPKRQLFVIQENPSGLMKGQAVVTKRSSVQPHNCGSSATRCSSTSTATTVDDSGVRSPAASSPTAASVTSEEYLPESKRAFSAMRRKQTPPIFTTTKEYTHYDRSLATASSAPTSLPGAVAVANSHISLKHIDETNRSKMVKSSPGRRGSQRSASNDDFENEPSFSNNDQDETTPASATTPPVFRSIDMLPQMESHSANGASSNIGGASGMISVVTEHSASTIPIRNTTARPKSSGTPSWQLLNRVSLIPTTVYEDVAPPPSKLIAKMCTKCGQRETHKEERYGPFDILRRMKPQTVEGRVYKGYCLGCHDIHDLRELLHDPTIPRNLTRHDSETIDASLRLMRDIPETQDPLFTIPPRKQRLLEVLCASVRFQIICVAILLAIFGACIGVGVTLSESAEPWESRRPTAAPSFPPTTMAPTSAPTSRFEWNLSTVISMYDIDSFGYNVELSEDGTIMAVASPKFDGSIGRVDVFNVEGDWQQAIGDPIIGGIAFDELGTGMHLSGNGNVVAVGLPGNNAGLVQVYLIDRDAGALAPMGQPLVGTSLLSQFGYSVALNFDGTRLFVGAPKYSENAVDIYGSMQAYEFNGNEWIEKGDKKVGATSGSLFGYSVATNQRGEQVAVGAPLNDEAGEDAGRVYVYGFINQASWAAYKTGTSFYGPQEGSELGKTIALHCGRGEFVVAGYDQSTDDFLDAGTVTTWGWHPIFDFEQGNFDAFMMSDPVSGSQEGDHFGYDVAMDCSDSGILTVMASSENRNGYAGSARVIGVYPVVRRSDNIEFPGPELGDALWLGNGPSVTMAGNRRRVAIGYQSILLNGVSRSEVHIYDGIATDN